MADGGHDRGPGHDLHRSRRAGRGRYGHPSGRRRSRAERSIGDACEIHSGVRVVDATIGDGAPSSTTAWSRTSRSAATLDVGPFAHLRNADDDRRGREGRQLRRDEEDHARRRVEGDAPRVSRRRGDRFRRQHRRRHDHVQLRRRPEESTTTIEDGAFIGSDTQLIAPVTVGRGAYVGTGHDDPRGRPGRVRSRSARASSGTSRAGSRRKRKKT